ncbi:WD40/YVTN/BNR-like repeat-containing protein [Halapricum desulfuricans]|uniref:BNR repeat-containing protein n=1 Tax=Halapricum desulfuricans TaxID=2841257 RepID=A0A897N4E8_9EURY|nr:hypothetical protein [Halapricum desulfuricans]QSG07361.1 BNR repeat-containing protein [Halapricum desulfuricans]
MPTVYAALDDRVLAARGSSGSWRTAVRLQGRNLQALAASPARPERVFVGADGSGLWRGTEKGRAFDRVWLADAPGSVTAVAVSPHDPDVIWAGTEPSAVYRSRDAGETWSRKSGLTDLPSASEWSFPPRPETHHVRWIEPDPHDRGRLYVGIEAGAFVRSGDGGSTWKDRPESAPRDVHEIVTHRAAGRVYVAAGDGYAESADGGDSWRFRQRGLDHRYVWSVAVDPDDPEHVLVSAATSAHRAHDPDGQSHVYRRVGDRWELTMDGLPGPDGLARAVLGTGPDGACYALTNHGLFRSPTGDGWHRLPVDWQRRYRESLPRGLAVV